jgi:hypothetical protein
MAQHAADGAACSGIWHTLLSSRYSAAVASLPLRCVLPPMPFESPGRRAERRSQHQSTGAVTPAHTSSSQCVARKYMAHGHTAVVVVDRLPRTHVRIQLRSHAYRCSGSIKRILRGQRLESQPPAYFLKIGLDEHIRSVDPSGGSADGINVCLDHGSRCW